MDYINLIKHSGIMSFSPIEAADVEQVGFTSRLVSAAQ